MPVFINGNMNFWLPLSKLAIELIDYIKLIVLDDVVEPHPGSEFSRTKRVSLLLMRPTSSCLSDWSWISVVSWP